MHAAEGRLDLALEADEIGLTTADTLADSDSATDMRTLVAALTRKGKHLGIVGRIIEGEDCLRTAFDTDPETANLVTEELDRGSRSTLVAALENAEIKLGPFEQYHRLLALSEPAPGMTLATVSGRTDPESAAVRATELAELIRPLLAAGRGDRADARARGALPVRDLVRAGVAPDAVRDEHLRADLGPAAAGHLRGVLPGRADRHRARPGRLVRGGRDRADPVHRRRHE